MKIILLTHERELNRETNTGSIAVNHSNGIVERIIWERVNPNQVLIDLIENKKVLLVYSKSEALSSGEVVDLPVEASVENYEYIIIIDSTWQEARKIFNRSPYLKMIPQTTIKASEASSYKLRRNQPEGGLCTIECIIEILRIKGQINLATELTLKYKQFNCRL